jgi:hypothetical protein
MFEIKRTTATFGMFHPREEKNKGNAFDVPFKITIGAEYLDVLLPAQKTEEEDEALNPETFIFELYTVEGYVRRPAFNPITIHREIEGAVVTIWDHEDFTDPLVLKPCNLDKLKVELRSPHQLVLSGQIQYSKYTDAELLRINALSNKSFDLAVLHEQPDLFEDHQGLGDEKGADDREADADQDADVDQEKRAKQEHSQRSRQVAEDPDYDPEE